MSSETNTPFENKSDIPAVELPLDGFQSRLPAYLLEGKTEAEKFLLTEMSKTTHFIEWAAPILVNSNLQSRRTNGKVAVLWGYKEVLASWKGVIATIAGLAAFVASITEIYPWLKAFFLRP